MRQHIRLAIIGVSLGMVLAGSTALPTFAQAQTGSPEANGLSISPPLFEISANPGDTIQHSIRVDNLTGKDMPITLDRKDFVPMGEEGQAALTDKTTNYSLASWIKVDDENITIPAKGSKTVDFTINIPSKAEPGGHFGSLVFRTKLGEKTDSTGVAVGQEVGALLLLKVAGQVTEKADIVSFKAAKTLWQGGPIGFSSRLENKGNVQLKPTGTITINNLFGKKVGTVPLESRTILPGSIRKLNNNWRGSSWPGWYTATLSVGYGNKDQILTSTTRFVIFPYKIIIPVLVIIVLAVVLIIRARTRLARAVRILFGKE